MNLLAPLIFVFVKLYFPVRPVNFRVDVSSEVVIELVLVLNEFIAAKDLV